MTTNKLIYKLLAVQIVPFWEAIKYACVKADEISEQDLAWHFNSLLQDLLSDKAQCFVVLNEDKVLQAIINTRIIIDKTSLIKELFVRNMYSVSSVTESDILSIRNVIADFAKKEGCKVATFNSRNPRVWNIAQLLGTTERYRSFIYYL